MSRPTNTDGKDDQIAALLTQGATYSHIRAQLGTYDRRIMRVRTERGIPVPPERVKRPKTEIDASEQQVIRMLRNGATREEIRAATRITPNRITQLRKDHNIPVPRRQRHRLTLDEAFARHTTATDGHLLWTGRRRGPGFELRFHGTTYDPRRIAFRKHHGRDPVAYVLRIPSCDLPDCIAGAHHADQTIRRNNLRTNP